MRSFPCLSAGSTTKAGTRTVNPREDASAKEFLAEVGAAFREERDVDPEEADAGCFSATGAACDNGRDRGRETPPAAGATVVVALNRFIQLRR